MVTWYNPISCNRYTDGQIWSPLLKRKYGRHDEHFLPLSSFILSPSLKHGAKGGRGHGGHPPQRKMCAPPCPPNIVGLIHVFTGFSFFSFRIHHSTSRCIIYPFPCSARLDNGNKQRLPRSLTRPRYSASLIKNIFAPPPPLNLWLRACHPYLQLKLAHAYHVALIYLHHIAY